jgi:hypothetical protein
MTSLARALLVVASVGLVVGAVAASSAPRPVAPSASGAAGPVCPAVAGAPVGPGVGHGAALSALFMPGVDGWQVGAEIKIVWRMTGAGAFEMVARGPAGVRVVPVWGPEAHAESNFQQPGDEWGTGWVFPAAGCWTLHATRAGGQSGDLAVRIEARSHL